jgi:hypothetical protein
LTVTQNALELTFDAEWLEANPLTAADLERERNYLSEVDYELRFS